MCNISILGAKNLNGIMFIDNGETWKVFQDIEGEFRIRLGEIFKIKNESDYELYNRGLELKNEYWKDAVPAYML